MIRSNESIADRLRTEFWFSVGFLAVPLGAVWWRHLGTLAFLLLFGPAFAQQAKAGADCNGTTGFYELASNLGIAGDAELPITVSAWVRPDAVSGSDDVFAIGDKGAGTADNVRAFLSSGIANTSAQDTGATQSTSAASKTATTGRWYHVVAVLSDTRTESMIWVDGSFVGGGSGTARVQADLDTTVIGAHFDATPAATAFFDGAISRVAVWNVALNEGEVQSLTQGARPCNVRRSSLILWIPGRAINGTSCTDLVGGRSFTKNGTITDSTEDGPTAFKRPGLGSWTPASLTGVVVWLKGDAGVTGTAPVTAWADQSGAGNDLDNTGTGAPATAATGYNGKVGVAFTNDSLYGEPAPVTAAPHYGLIAGSFVTVANNDRALGIFDKDLDTESWRIGGTATTLTWTASSVLGSSDSANLAVAQGPAVTSLEWDEVSNVSRRFSKNAGQQGTNTQDNSPLIADRWSVGRLEDATPDGSPDDMTLYELVVCTTDPGNAGRVMWFVYCRQRHGVRGGPWRYERRKRRSVGPRLALRSARRAA